MSTQAVHYVAVEEYLEHEINAERRSEYLHGEVFPMEDVSPAHAMLVANLTIAIGQKAWAKKCTVYAGPIVSISPTGLYTIPDLMVVSGEPQYGDAKKYSITNPKLLFEVESPTTKDRDMGKIRDYGILASLEEYVIVAQDTPTIFQFQRQPANAWMLQEIKGLDAILSLRSLDLDVPFAAIYRGISFPSA